MKTIFKIMLATPFVAGAYFAGYFVAKKKYENLADKEVANVKEKLNKYYSEQGASVSSTKVDPTTKTKCVKEEKKEITHGNSIEKNQTSEDKYFNYAKQYMSESVEKKIEAEKEATKKEVNKNKPYIISFHDYEASEFIAKTLYFYTTEGILTDTDGRHLDSPEELIGEAAIQELNKQTDDTIYVRNERFEADFEIVIIYGSIYSKSSKERVIPEEYEK